MSTYVIRCGETDYDLEDRVQGTLNLPLNATGRRQVAGIVADLRGAGLDVIYASPTEPALTTAQRIADQLDVPLKVLSGLANLDHGLWEGLCLSEIRQKQPRVYRQWEEAPGSVCPPCGEKADDAIARVNRALRRPMRRGGTFAVVAPEPMATLVSCVLRGELPHLPGPISLAESRPKIERLEPETAGAATSSWSWTRQ